MIKTMKTKSDFGLLLFDQETLEKLYEESGPLAVRNEWQFHYTSIVGIKEIDGQKVYVSVPLVCYNYEQFVSYAHIDFHLKDVENMSQETLPIAIEKAEEFMDTELRLKIEEKFGEMDLWTVMQLQSMHRHPSGNLTGTDSFSGTDLDSNIKNPGIIYPYSEIENGVNFASIMHCVDEDVMLAHTEMRTCDGSVEDGGSLTYKHGKSFTLVKGDASEPTVLEKIFNVDAKNIETYGKDDGTFILNSTLDGILDAYDFKPEVFIDSSLVKLKRAKTATTTFDPSAWSRYLDDPKNTDHPGQAKFFEEMIDQQEQEFLYYADIKTLPPLDYIDLVEDLRMEIEALEIYHVSTVRTIDDEWIIKVAIENEILKPQTGERL